MTQTHLEHKNESISLSEIIVSIKLAFRYLLKHWYIIAIFSFAGIGYGLYKTYTTETEFTASAKFALEEDKAAASSMSVYGNSAGFNTDMSGGGNLLIGDNLLGLMKSRIVIKRALLHSFDTVGKKSIAERFIEVYKLREEWVKGNPKAQDIRFEVSETIPDFASADRYKAAYFQNLVNMVIGQTTVDKTDKKMTFVSYTLTTRDEMLSKKLGDAIIYETSEFYKEFKTAKLRQNIKDLSRQLDSLLRLSTGQSYSAARGRSSSLDVNPAFQETYVPIETTNRDKTLVQTAITNTYSQLTNAKISLASETPVLTMVDDIELPLSTIQPQKFFNIILGAILGTILGVIFLFVRRLFKKYK